MSRSRASRWYRRDVVSNFTVWVVKILLASAQGYGNKREVGDRSVAGGEHDDGAATRHLPRHALDVIARRVHEVVPVALVLNPLRILQHALQTRRLRLLHRRAQRLDRDVVQTAVEVAATRVRLRAHAHHVRRVLVPRLRRHELLRHVDVPHLVQNVRVRADQLVRLRENRASPAANYLLRDGALQRVGRDAREGVAASTLKRQTQGGDGLRGATCREGCRKHLANGGGEKRRLFHCVLERHPLQRQRTRVEADGAHGLLDLLTVDDVATHHGQSARILLVVHDDGGTHVGVDEEARQCAENLVLVQRLRLHRAFRVNAAHDTVHILSGRLEVLLLARFGRHAHDTV